MGKPEMLIGVFNRSVSVLTELPEERDFLRVVRTRFYHPDVNITIVLMNSARTPVNWAWVASEVTWLVVNEGYTALALRDTLARRSSGSKRKVSPKQMNMFGDEQDG